VQWTAGTRPAHPYPEAGTTGAEFMTVLIRPEGTSKTALAMAIAKAWSENADNRLAMILNFNMRIDTDSSLALIGDLLRFEEGRSRAENMNRTSSRETEFAKDCIGLKNGDELMIILKGLERIFDVNGHPLSAEFDHFLRIMARRADDLPRIRFVVIGTERVKRYFEGLETIAGCPTIRIPELSAAEASKQVSAYLEFLSSTHSFGALEKAKLENRKLADYSARRRTLYRSILMPSALAAKGVADPDLALEIVTVMSFIGQPIEQGGLFHAPAIQKRLAVYGDIEKRREAFKTAFDDLLDKVHLVKEINKRSRRAEHQRRYSVHLSLQTEIRDRNGIPLSDSILSTAYNMSLFSAQPADGALPEAQVHDGLGRLVDWLVGAYKDDPLDPGAAKGDRGAPHVVAALRAAVSLVRGLYSTSALLSVDRGDRLIGEDREGLLSEHAQRLERILDAFDAMWVERGSGEADGAEPLYPDELVWLHNERGVVKLAQGDLYEARFSFDEADRINRLYVEFNDESHNWRRITLNQIVVDIERGHLQKAENRMNAIERQLGSEKTNRIRIRYLDSRSVRRIRFDPVASHEDILAMALITGYRGLTSHLKGELDAARIYFERAVRVLQRMDEQRALALFRRHKASLHNDLGDPESLRRESKLAVSGAESVRQLDIVYAGRLLEACLLDVKGDSADKKAALRLALEALDYATLADMHRLAIEAEARIALAKYGSGDYNAAIEHAAEAMATATRYGMTLHKISLRTLLGRILISRGNGDAGRTLIRSAINGALRVGYQRAIESARLALTGSA
jgi:tetratricopeptide (TPR) repeat protein